MRRIENNDDRILGTITYELDDGRWLRVDARMVQECGLPAVLRMYGLDGEAERARIKRVPVMQYGRRVGTVPGDFDPAFARSNSFIYRARPGDLRREGDAWVADRTLGASDLDCLVGFVRDPEPGLADGGVE